MNTFRKKFYEVLIRREKFYIKQYYSDFRKNNNFIAIKELNNGIYCVLISDEEEKNVDYNEAMEYLKTLGKSFSLNMVILSSGENMDSLNMANKIVINKENYNIISCDESCIPLRILINNIDNLSNLKKGTSKTKFLEYKIPTLTIILINIILFAITQITIQNMINSLGISYSIKIPDEIKNSITNTVLIKFGAKYNDLIQQGEYWRVITCAFLHSGFIHIASNMYSLYIIGPEIDQIYGRFRYLIIYIVSCVTSTSLSYIMNPNSISVGASGAIFGLMGALLAFAIIERKKLNRKYISSLLQVIAINLFIGLSLNNIDNSAHIGGIIGGLVLGYIFYKLMHSRKNNKPVC
ncbi:rhomboid family intramembrane serine protease [Clostridium saccharobutylicum]|uniref:Rhomboid protease GluP n=1 Tax=Clostridium saccharobutylicum TaxID=169679 RepID=A0A1S8NIN8_CLOSA|nr:rhomboid family intramembrane serine protease [Clostridium saccharobutylicum]OOM16310.1 rhomboid protease GluP [Clostridium saccharobutylicum]